MPAGARSSPPDVIANRGFAFACLATLLMSATFFAALLYLPQFMQKILGWSPLEAGAGFLPMMATFAVVSFAAGSLYQRLGAKVVLSAGAACLAAGAFLVSLVDAHSGWGALVPGMAVLGLGVGLFYSSVTTAAVTALDPSRASLAGGIVYMFQIAGGSIGLGLTTTVFTTAATDTVQRGAAALPARDADAVRGVLAGTGTVEDLSGRAAALAHDAFAAGIQWGFRLVAARALAGFVVTVLAVGGRLRRARVAPATR